MWILPKQLHTSPFVPDMAALISDSNEQSQAFAQSLLVRSKPSPVRTWSLKWKRDSWTQHLSGRMLKPSLGACFVTAWTCSLGVIPVSHFPQPENDSEKKTPDTCGLGSQMELPLCDPGCASLKTSKGTSVSDSKMSSETWKALVTKRRGEYSARAKSALLTAGNEYLSWPTARAACPGSRPNGKGGKVLEEEEVRKKANYGLPAPDNRKTNGSHRESWTTPQAGDYRSPNANPGSRSQSDQLPQSDHALPRLVGGRLNPRWVEVLMGLPVGWVMASCASPVTIAPTNCGSLATELSHNAPSGRSESCANS